MSFWCAFGWHDEVSMPNDRSVIATLDELYYELGWHARKWRGMGKGRSIELPKRLLKEKEALERRIIQAREVSVCVGCGDIFDASEVVIRDVRGFMVQIDSYVSGLVARWERQEVERADLEARAMRWHHERVQRASALLQARAGRRARMALSLLSETTEGRLTLPDSGLAFPDVE